MVTPVTPLMRCIRATALLFMLGVCGCSTYSGKAQAIRPLMQARDYSAALKNLESLKDGGSRLLYLYERGLILHFENHFAESNAEFESAELLLDDLYTRSLSREGGALLTNDNLVEYRGERFEAAFVHYYKTLNFLHLGQVEEAAVECRRLNLRLRTYRDDPSSFYVDDPFLQYLTGLVYQEIGEHTDANVSFRLAASAYDSLQGTFGVERPAHFFCDLAQNAVRLGDEEEAARFSLAGNCDDTTTTTAQSVKATNASSDIQTGTVQVFLECGYVPYKEQSEILLPILANEITDGMDRDAYSARLAERRSWDSSRRQNLKVEYLLRVTIPKLALTPSRIASARVRASSAADTIQAPTILASNLSLLATRSFEAREGTILLRTVTRGLAKYMAARQAKKKSGEFAGLLVNLVGAVTESADTRAWSTLPDKILLAQLELPPGTYDLEVNLVDRDGEREPFLIRDVTVAAGHTTFINHRVF